MEPTYLIRIYQSIIDTDPVSIGGYTLDEVLIKVNQIRRWDTRFDAIHHIRIYRSTFEHSDWTYIATLEGK